MDAFIKLTTKLTNPRISIEDKLKEICRITALLVKGADRVSLWRFNESFDGIEAIICYDVKSNNFTRGQKLNRIDFDAYFKGILEKEVINAPKARTNPYTMCFNESYFNPLNIYSLLDFILHDDFSPTGVICCESVGKVSHWSNDNIDSLRRVANASSMYFKFNG